MASSAPPAGSLGRLRRSSSVDLHPRAWQDVDAEAGKSKPQKEGPAWKKGLRWGAMARSPSAFLQFEIPSPLPFSMPDNRSRTHRPGSISGRSSSSSGPPSRMDKLDSATSRASRKSAEPPVHVPTLRRSVSDRHSSGDLLERSTREHWQAPNTFGAVLPPRPAGSAGGAKSVTPSDASTSLYVPVDVSDPDNSDDGAEGDTIDPMFDDPFGAWPVPPMSRADRPAASFSPSDRAHRIMAPLPSPPTTLPSVPAHPSSAFSHPSSVAQRKVTRRSSEATSSGEISTAPTSPFGSYDSSTLKARRATALASMGTDDGASTAASSRSRVLGVEEEVVEDEQEWTADWFGDVEPDGFVDLPPFPCRNAEVLAVTVYRSPLLRHVGSTGAFRLPSRPWRPWRPQLVSVSKLTDGSHFLHSFAGTFPESAAVELGRLQLGSASIVCVLEESLDGEMRVLKVTGTDASGDRLHDDVAPSTFTAPELSRPRGKDGKHKRRADTAPRSSPLPPGSTAWFLAMDGPGQLKAWMAALKGIVADLRETELVRSADASARLERLHMLDFSRVAEIELDYQPGEPYPSTASYGRVPHIPSKATYSVRSAGSEGSRGAGDGASVVSDRRRLRRPSHTNPLPTRHDVATHMSATAPRNRGLVTDEELDVLAGLSRALDQGLAGHHSPTTGADSDGPAGSMLALADGPSGQQPGSVYHTQAQSRAMPSRTDRVPLAPTSPPARRPDQRPLPALPTVTPSSPSPRTPKASRGSPTQPVLSPLTGTSLSSSRGSAESGVLGDYWREDPRDPVSPRRPGDVPSVAGRRGARLPAVDDIWAESQEDLLSADAEAAVATSQSAELARQHATMAARTGGRIKFLPSVRH